MGSRNISLLEWDDHLVTDLFQWNVFEIADNEAFAEISFTGNNRQLYMCIMKEATNSAFRISLNLCVSIIQIRYNIRMQDRRRVGMFYRRIQNGCKSWRDSNSDMIETL